MAEETSELDLTAVILSQCSQTETDRAIKNMAFLSQGFRGKFIKVESLRGFSLQERKDKC